MKLKTFIENPSYACREAEKHDLTILIEPLNEYDPPGYFLQTTDQASKIIHQIERSNLNLMFDCYHVQLMEGDLTQKLTRLMPHIGHIQFAGLPKRGRLDLGEVGYGHIFRHLSSLGYTAPFGAKCKVAGPIEETLSWMKTLRT
jgi:hydroxypyruvate isomerase